MRVGIDARYLSHGLVGGVHTYLANLLPALLEEADGEAVFLYADTRRPFELASVPKGVALRHLPYRGAWSSVINDWKTLREAMEADHVEVAHFPANYGFGPVGARTVITVHDEINLMPWREIVRGHRKDARTMLMMTYLHLCTRAAVRRAQLLLTVSEYARKQIARYSGFAAERILPTYHAPAPDWHRQQDLLALAEVRRRYHLPEKFILADGIKNPGVLVRAWPRLPQALRGERRMVFFSRRPDPPSVIQEAVRQGWAVLLIRPSRADLMALYSQAEAFVFPSLIEGFGIPILEAMTCGAPVVASTCGSIPEVAGGAARLMKAEDDVALAAHLASLLSDTAEAERMRQLGFARAATFSWQRAARQTWAGYRQALAT